MDPVADSDAAVRVGVHPAAELTRRPRLFAALEHALPVRFEPAGADAAALVVMADAEGAPDPAGRRSYVVANGDRAPGPAPATVRFAGSSRLDARLRGRSLTEATPPQPLAAEPGDDVLAEIGGAAVWVRRGARDVVAGAPSELGPSEFLRDRIDPGRFLRLLPLVHFLREVAAGAAWIPPVLRACFVVDDPNLHWRSYGHLRYPDLVAHAREHRYHLAVALIPIDGWFAHGPTVRLFADHGDVLSLCVHGNDHRMHELRRLDGVEDARRVLAQAERRIAAFERRSGLTVARVVAPPFEACSAASAQAMFELGFDGVLHTRPYPWAPVGPGRSSHESPDPSDVLSGWCPAQLVAGGLPVVVRREFHEHDEIVLRAFLDQPIVLYGHVEDFRDGFEPLAEAAAAVNSLGPVTWGSLEAITETNVARRREDDVLALRPFARRLRIDVEPDVAALRFAGEAPARVRIAGAPRHEDRTSSLPATRSDPVSNGRFILPAARSAPLEVEVFWSAPRELVPASVAPPAFAPYPRVRRLLVEARDRLDPVRGRLRARAARLVH